MTDNEIIKALECCADDDSCNDCGFVYGDCNCGTYRLSLMQHALSLINRQKAEIEELEKEYDKVYEQAEANILGNMADGGTSCHWCIEKHRANAIKEFAERLKRVVAIHNGDMWSKYEYIDNLVKEMVGDDNEKV